jgi:hypothetical protein
MNVTADDPDTDHPRSRRLRFELIFGSLWLAFGLFLLPALIFWVGSLALGSYGENAGLSVFYIDFFGDLADGVVRAWLIALGPVVLIYLLRAVFIGVQSSPAGHADLDQEDAPPEPIRRAPPAYKEPKRPTGKTARVEPRMSGD